MVTLRRWQPPKHRQEGLQRRVRRLPATPTNLDFPPWFRQDAGVVGWNVIIGNWFRAHPLLLESFEYVFKVAEKHLQRVARSRSARARPLPSNYPVYLHAFDRTNGTTYDEDIDVGFRVASIPEPGSITLLATGAVGLLAYAWRKVRNPSAATPKNVGKYRVFSGFPAISPHRPKPAQTGQNRGSRVS